MRFRHAAIAFVLALAFYQATEARPQSGAKKPLNQVQVLALLGGQVPSHRVGMLVEERGINFEPKDDFLNEVSRSGGDQELLDKLRRANVVKPTAIDPAASAKEAEVRQHIARSIEFEQKGQFTEAEQEVRAALQLWPKNSDLLVDLSSALQSEGKWEESIDPARQAVRLGPQNSTAHAEIGVALGSKHDLEGAGAELREAVRLDPNNDYAHYNLGVLLMIKNDSDGAIAEYREALRINPKNAAAHYGLGKRLEFYKSDRPGALEEYRAAYALSPSTDTYKSSFERLSGELNH